MAREMADLGFAWIELSHGIRITLVPGKSQCVLVFGQEGPGLSEEVRARAEAVCSIAMFGSTRSINAGVASGIAMHAWVRRHAASPETEPGKP